MALNTNTTASGGLAPEVQVYLERVLLSRLLPRLVYMLFGQAKPMPRNSGQSVSFRRFSSLSPAITPLTEGITPDGDTLTVTSLPATPKQYGKPVTITDLVDFTSFDPILAETAELLGEQAAETMDTVVRDTLFLGTSVQYAAGRVSRVTVAATDKLNATEIMKAVRTLQRNRVKPVTAILDASTGVGTVPVNGGYVGIVSADTLFDLKQDAKFVTVEKYGTKVDLLPGEVGALDEVRFIRTDLAKVYTGAGAAAIDVHGTLIFGRDAYGIVQPDALQMYATPPGAGEDFLRQRSTLAWKAFFCAVILQQLAIIRIEHAVTP